MNAFSPEGGRAGSTTWQKSLFQEFMDEAAVADLRASFDVLYDKTLVDRPEELAAAAAGCRALIVRNRTQVRSARCWKAHICA